MSSKNKINSSTWKGLRADTGLNIMDSRGKIKKGIKVFGHVTANHASTVVNTSRNRKTRKEYNNFVGSTHQLSEKTQAYISRLLDNPGVNKVYIYGDDDRAGKK